MANSNSRDSGLTVSASVLPTLSAGSVEAHDLREAVSLSVVPTPTLSATL
jgi:hypothetical protein